MNQELKAQLVIGKKADLGEGAIWNQRTSELWWVDIEQGIFYTYNPETGVEQSFAMDQRIGTVVPSKNGNAIVALQDGIYEYNLVTRTKALIVSPEDPARGNRFNDGKCDSLGRLWAGTLNLEDKEGVAALYRIESSGKASRMLSNVSCSNGICWSHDNKTMYYIDTPTGMVQAFDFDLSEGTISNGRIAIRIPREMGLPDGMTIDARGMLWIALWNGSCVTQWEPGSGRLLSRISVPAFNVTSCAFGGKDLDTLYITSASVDTPPGEKEKFPLAGSLFKAVPGVSGVPSFFFDN
ncbi:MAG TPA: SMP-30/gluconolactonase/LRE family protein [Cyclobacteriaceae bacterium]